MKKRHTKSAKLSWSHYRRLLSVESREALRGGLKNNVLASQYRLQLPNEKKLKAELTRVQKEFKILKHTT